MTKAYAIAALALSSLMIVGLVLWLGRVPDGARAAGPDIVVSVTPLAAAVREVVGADVAVQAVLEPGADMHHFSFTPSQRRMVATAKLDLTAFPRPQAEDPHIWLDEPALMAFLARVPGADMAGFAARRRAWVLAVQVRLASLAEVPFIVEHDAYQGFERDMSLRGKLGALRTGHDAGIGARGLSALQGKIAGQRVCLLHEPGANLARLRTMLDGAEIVAVEADPMLWGAADYFKGMDRLAHAFEECLSEAATQPVGH